jgi:hypothetical protein
VAKVNGKIDFPPLKILRVFLCGKRRCKKYENRNFIRKAINANWAHFSQCQDGNTPNFQYVDPKKFLTPTYVKMLVTFLLLCRKTLDFVVALRISGKLPYKLTEKNVSNFEFLTFVHFSQRCKKIAY